MQSCCLSKSGFPYVVAILFFFLMQEDVIPLKEGKRNA